MLYATKGASGPVQDPAVKAAANTFLTDFFNFTPKTVDSDFNAITAMATGQFSSQANAVLQLDHPQAARDGDASSRGQVRYLAVQQEGNPRGHGVDLRRGRPDLRQQQVDLARL